MASTAPPSRRSQRIQDILDDLEPPSPAALESLENHVSDQMEQPELYDIQCNLALLRHYAASPGDCSLPILQSILALALMHLPASDFTVCLCLTPLAIQSEAPAVRALMDLDDLLQTCQFRRFWTQLAEDAHLRDVTGSVQGFKDGIRRFMAGVISLTYQTISCGEVCHLLDFESTPQLVAFCQSHLKGKWSVESKSGSKGDNAEKGNLDDCIVVVARKAAPLGQTMPTSIDLTAAQAGKDATKSLLSLDSVSRCLTALNRIKGGPAPLVMSHGAAHLHQPQAVPGSTLGGRGQGI